MAEFSISALEKARQNAQKAGDSDAVNKLDQAIQERQAQEFNLGSDVESNGGLRDALGGAKHAFDRAAYGLANSVAALVGDDFVDSVGPSRQERDSQLDQGRSFVDEASGWANAGELAGDIGIASVPGGAIYRGSKLLTNGLRAGVGKGSANIGLNAAGNAGVAAGLAPEDKERAALLAGSLGAGADVAMKGMHLVSAGLPASMAKIKPHAQELMDRGVNIPFNKAAESGWVRRMGEVGRGFPIAGPALKAQDDVALRSYTADKAKSAMPEKLPEVDEAGNRVWVDNATEFTDDPNFLSTLKQQWDDAYQALYRDNNVKIPLVKEGSYNLRQAADDLLKEPLRYREVAGKQAQKAIYSALDDLETYANGSTKSQQSMLINPETGKPFVRAAGNNGSVPADNFGEVLAQLEKAAHQLRRDQQNDASSIVFEFAQKLREARIAGAPKEIQDLIKPMNARYARYKLLSKAMQGLSANRAGMVNPNELNSALKSVTPNKEKFARRKTFMGDELYNDIDVLGDVLPSVGPGTAEKLGAIEAYTNPSLKRALIEGAVGNMNKLLTGQTGVQKKLNQAFVSQSDRARALRQMATGVPAGVTLYGQSE